MARNGGKNKKYARKEIKRIDGSERKSPNSLREILNHIRETEDCDGGVLSHTLFLEKLNASWGARRYGIGPINKSVYERTEDGNHALGYRDIEMYARQTGVPGALLLLLSRVRAELSPVENIDRAVAVLVGIEAAAAAIRAQLQGGRADDLDVRAAIAAYKNAGGPAPLVR